MGRGQSLSFSSLLFARGSGPQPRPVRLWSSFAQVLLEPGIHVCFSVTGPRAALGRDRLLQPEHEHLGWAIFNDWFDPVPPIPCGVPDNAPRIGEMVPPGPGIV